MKKNLIKFLITVSILLTTFNTNILAQNRISGEKLEKLLTENYIIIYDFFGPLRNNDNIEINFDAGSKTYSLKGSFPLQQNIIHPRSGTWEIVGFGKSIVRLDDIQNQNQYTNQNARIQLFFGDDGNIYNINQKLYSYRLENKKERIENNARRIEEERKAEELRLKKIEEEKKQLAIKREQERIKAEQIKKDEEKKRFELEEYLKKQEEERIKRQNEEKIKLEREELFKNILKYSLIVIGITLIAGVIYYVNKFHKDKAKNLFLNLKNSFKNIKNLSNLKAAFNKPPNLLNLKDFNISKSTLFKMTDHNTFEIKFKKKVLKEELFDFLKKNLPENRWGFFGVDISKHMWSLKSNWNTNDNYQIYVIKCLGFTFRYQYLQNFKYAEEFTNLVNKKFSSLKNYTSDEIFQFKSLISEQIKNNGNITLTSKILITITCLYSFLFITNITSNKSSTSTSTKTSSYNYLEAQRPYYLRNGPHQTHTECIYNKNGVKFSRYMEMGYPCPNRWTEY
jgi:gamma-glutamylcyclotransferase (GGCT)/AIG2-like uncharacterized protein YtfP